MNRGCVGLLVAPRKGRRAVSIWAVAVLGFVLSGSASGRGVTPYLPLNLAPHIERDVERLMILAGKPVMRRPIAAATVLDALANVCDIDALLCARVKSYLEPYQRDVGVAMLQVQGIVSSENSKQVISNAHGRNASSPWQIAGQAYYQPSDYLLLNIGGIAYQGRSTPTGSLLSVGFDLAQLDIGFRDHWFSPMTDSSMLISTEAPTMPSVTLSNYRPISFLGINYEVFLATASHQNDIQYFNAVTSGRPKIAGLQVGLEPVLGYSIALNRVMQFGGGARGGSSLSDLRSALISNPNRSDAAGVSEEFGNQVASITSSIVFPGSVPFVARMEYAGEDNGYSGSKRLADSSLTLGIDFPALGDRYDLTYEMSEWQNVWYTHHIYPEGLTNHQRVLGHWFGDQREFGDRKSGRSHALQVGLMTDAGNYWRGTYRTLAFSQSLGYEITPPIPYRHLHQVGIEYSTRWQGRAITTEVSAGRDAFGDSLATVSASIDLAKSVGYSTQPSAVTGYADADPDVEIFVDTGVNTNRVYDFSYFTGTGATATRIGYHFAVGARRPVAEHSDLGVRLEFDDVDGRSMISFRAVDYRYRFTRSLAASAFFGVGRYQYGAPAFGYYWGAGLQRMDVFRNWDVGVDLRHYDKLSRNWVLAEDSRDATRLPRIYFDAKGYSVYASRRF